MLFVSFMLDGTLYGVEVAEVYGIYQGLPVIPTPDAPLFVAGEVQLVNRRIPVINLRRFAGLSDANALRSPNWILIVDNPKGPVGFVVDRVSEVVKLSPAHITVFDGTAPGPVGDYVLAVAPCDNQQMYMLDLSRLLHDAVQ